MSAWKILPLLGLLCVYPVETKAAQAPALAAPSLAYADLADLAQAAPAIAHVKIVRARTLREKEATGVPPGHRRFLVRAEVAALIRGAAGLPREVRYLVDLPNDLRGRPARLRRGSEHLLFASTAPGEPEELRLVAPDAQIPYSPAAADQVREIVREMLAADAAPRITGFGRAFHVPGALPGESETQIFLQTAEGRPISLNVLRRPGERPRWAVALGEIVDAAAAPPETNTLLWYRLACTLPRRLPPQSVRDLDRAEAGAVETDYRLILERLGPCGRTRARR